MAGVSVYHRVVDFMEQNTPVSGGAKPRGDSGTNTPESGITSSGTAPAPDRNATLIRYWFLAGAVMVFLILIVGGITRLTQSGLSIVDWKPISGVIPPLNETQWEAEFDRYRAFPEYQQRNKGMSMSEFKFIFFWEYLHRMLARAIGFVFLIPFIWFASQRMFTRRQFKQAMLLFFLGFAQGFMGWYMVQSGLVDNPYVSPFRLAAHLSLAFAIFGACIWFAMETWPRFTRVVKASVHHGTGSWYQSALWTVVILFVVQVVWGALVAGHKAGYFFNTFPTMEGYWLPPQLWTSTPAWVNFFDNIVTVQWTHRLIGTLLLLATGGLVWLSRRADSLLKTTALSLGAGMAVQYLLGVFTLLLHVPISLGVIHQATAMVLFGILLAVIFRHRRITRAAAVLRQSA